MKKLTAPKTSSRGIVMGKAYVIKREALLPASYTITAEEAADEIERFKEAVESSVTQLQKLSEYSDVFNGHLELCRDEELKESVVSKIQYGMQNAESALFNTAEEYYKIFQRMEDDYMRERSVDIKDICGRLMKNLKGVYKQEPDEINEKMIIIAEELEPSETASLNMKNILGIITKNGGVTSHASIMAGGMGLPILVGVKEIVDEVKTGDYVIMDAGKGIVLINPDDGEKTAYQIKEEEFKKSRKLLETCCGLPSVTRDGKTVKVCANIGSMENLSELFRYHPDGIGLFRSEFLYVKHENFPSEEEQLLAYKIAAQSGKGEINIRTLDIGGDKELPYFKFEKEQNPFLGWRSIRISLEMEPVFKAQLRAILRASAYGNIRIMFPMIISLEELQRAKKLLDICKQELDGENIPYNLDIKVGMMVETPASVILIHVFCRFVDFLSIGTNDLTQYILAVDRGNPKIANLYSSFHPAVLQCIKDVIAAGHEHKVSVGLCGEFAYNDKAVPLLIGMGLDEFSVAPAGIPDIKNIVRDSTFEDCKRLAEKVSEADTIEEVLNIVSQQ